VAEDWHILKSIVIEALQQTLKAKRKQRRAQKSASAPKHVSYRSGYYDRTLIMSWMQELERFSRVRALPVEMQSGISTWSHYGNRRRGCCGKSVLRCDPCGVVQC